MHVADKQTHTAEKLTLVNMKGTKVSDASYAVSCEN